MRDSINRITDSRIKREKESTFGVIAKFDSRINSELIWYESRELHLIGTPIRCTYLHFQDMTPESILEEIWYGSQGLHLIAAPICVFRNLVGLGQSHLGLDQSQIALNKLFQVGQSTRKLRQSRKT
jgi:hypothetical protein